MIHYSHFYFLMLLAELLKLCFRARVEKKTFPNNIIPSIGCSFLQLMMREHRFFYFFFLFLWVCRNEDLQFYTCIPWETQKEVTIKVGASHTTLDIHAIHGCWNGTCVSSGRLANMYMRLQFDYCFFRSCRTQDRTFTNANIYSADEISQW